jgi:hypothetical protein
MGWTVQSFRDAYPEFAATEEPLVTQALADAVMEFDPRVCGEYTDRLVGLRTAHYLAIAPFGQNTRTEGVDTVTTYSTTIAEILRIKAGGPWVAGYFPS